jgi:hypothetical protein
MSRNLILALLALGLAGLVAVPLVGLAQHDRPPVVQAQRVEPAPEPMPLPTPQPAPETAPEAEAEPEAGAEPPGGVQEGFSLLEEGTKLILRGLMNEMEPALRDMGEDLESALTEMQPAMRELARLIGDIRNYHPPEMLPNGDIILRRKVPPDPREPAPEGGPIDL